MVDFCRGVWGLGWLSSGVNLDVVFVSSVECVFVSSVECVFVSLVHITFVSYVVTALVSPRGVLSSCLTSYLGIIPLYFDLVS